MAGLSRSIFSLLQVLSSTDLMTAARLTARDVLELFGALTGHGPMVLSGLEVTGTAGGVSIAPGVLLEPYAGVVSPPRDDESQTVLGLLRTALAVDVPALGVATWYLIEARAAELDTFGSVLILNQTTQAETPTSALVKREASLLVRARAGTSTLLPAVQAGWQPIAAVQRPTTGPTTTVYDLRTLYGENEVATGFERFVRQDYALLDTTSSPPATIRLDVEVLDRNGQRLSSRVPTIPLLAIFEPGYTPATNEWAYLYLCTVGGVAPRTAAGRGVLVMSKKAPAVQGGRVPSSPIVPYGAWAGLGDVVATCVGCLRTGTFGFGGYMATQSCIAGRHVIYGDTPDCTAPGPLVATGMTDPTYLPLNARRATLHARWSSAAAADAQSVDVSGPLPGALGGFIVPDGRSEGDLSPIFVDGLNPATLTVGMTATHATLELVAVEL